MIRFIAKYPFNLLIASSFTIVLILIAMNSYTPKVLFCAATSDRVVALTVDDGPDPLYTPQIIEILKKYQIKATFFVVGSQVEKYPEILKIEMQNGNEIGNHTYNHPNMDTLDRKVIREEIERTNGIIYKVTGKNVNWFRPPRKNYDIRVVNEAANQGLETVLWTNVVETKKTKDPKVMADRVINNIKPGGIILLHDGRLDRTATIEALPIIIEELDKRGYKFVTLSELFEKQGTKI